MLSRAPVPKLPKPPRWDDVQRALGEITHETPLTTIGEAITGLQNLGHRAGYETGRDAAHYLLQHFEQPRAHRWRARIGEYTVPTNERGNPIKQPQIDGMETPMRRL